MDGSHCQLNFSLTLQISEDFENKEKTLVFFSGMGALEDTLTQCEGKGKTKQKCAMRISWLSVAV